LPFLLSLRAFAFTRSLIGPKYSLPFASTQRQHIRLPIHELLKFLLHRKHDLLAVFNLGEAGGLAEYGSKGMAKLPNDPHHCG
jgi:hypothetical protein